MPHRFGGGAFARKLGARTRSLRQAAGYTQEKLAIECRIDNGFLSQIESGKRLPSLPVLLALAEGLGCHPVDLLGFDLANPRLRLLDALRLGDREAIQKALAGLGLLEAPPDQET